MAYPFEMHFHTDEVSPCGNVPAAEAAAAYRREGYAGVVVTDHYAAYNFARFPGDWDTKVDAYLAGYRAAKAAGEPLGLTVLLGLELRLDGAEKTGEPALDALRDSINEYLVYGVTEEQLRRYPALYTLDEKRLKALAEQLGWFVTDWVAVSVGDGCTIGGVYNGFHDLYELGFIERIPKILGVQSTGCCPFVDAARENRDLIPAEENTLADSIAVGVPRNPKKALRAVSASNGAWIAVSDEDILATMGILGCSEGVFGEPAGVTATAGVMKAVQQGIIKPNETVTTISTGSGLKDVKNALRAAGRPHKCAPSIEALEASGII